MRHRFCRGEVSVKIKTPRYLNCAMKWTFAGTIQLVEEDEQLFRQFLQLLK